MKTIALVCPATVGHHRTYLRFFTRALLDLDCAVVAFTPEAADFTQWAASLHSAEYNRLRTIELHYSRAFRVPGPLSILFDKLAWVRFTGRLIQASGVRPDLVFHTWLDNCLTPGLTAGLTDLVFPFKWSGLYFHPWYLRQNLGYARIRVGPLANHAALQSRRCPGVAVLDEGIADKLQAHLEHKPVIVFPDLADDSPPDLNFAPAIQIRAQAAGRRIVGLLGVLSKRKGVLTLIEMAQQTAREPWYFVFAGEFDQASFLPQELRALSEFIQSNPPNCFFHLQHIPDEPQFNALVNVCDVVFAVYKNFKSSSNLLSKAALFHKPVLASDAYCMGERVHQYSLGLTVDENSVPQCLNALRQMSAQLDQTGGFASARFQEYTRRHSREQLQASFEAILSAAHL